MAINVTSDGEKLAFLQWHEGSNAALVGHSAPRKSKTPGTCPAWKTKAVDPIEAEIEKFGRARIYGILFDTDSDVIKPASQAVIERVAKVLKAKPEWNMIVEGHTDNTATAAHNQSLSERRAKAVKKALEAQGIEASRLTPTGKGQTTPVASNDTSAGRAQNRRVELAKE
jgi:outer membrane protein OmpA-like peptidoglycan-associated protein